MRSFSRYLFIILLSFTLIFPLTHNVAAQQDNPLTQSGEYASEGETSSIDEEAVKKLRKMSPEEIEELDKKLAEALTLYYDNKFGKAIPIFNEVAGNVETMDIMWWIGTSAMKSGQLELAREKFREMLAANPNLHRVRLELATIYFKMGQYEEARKEIETVKRANPPESVQK
ncbi:MAG: tetratricopeptide repeat protein, partial [Deltaproteobacteria bacterium]|nr:tetratricopeptide repeat protein [Deltaproteobacteria bacterium]